MAYYYNQCVAFKDDFTRCKCREGVKNIKLDDDGYCKFHRADRWKVAPNLRNRDVDKIKPEPSLLSHLQFE